MFIVKCFRKIHKEKYFDVFAVRVFHQTVGSEYSHTDAGHLENPESGMLIIN